MRLVIELKRDAIPKVVLNKLYKHTPMQTTFGVNMVALVDNVPRTLPLRSVIHNYVQHQREVIVRRTKHELRTLEAQVHRLEGLLIALDNLDAVIELIRARATATPRATGLIERFGLTLHPGPGDPRAAPPAADRARGGRDQARARRQGRADRASCARCSATRTRCSRLIKEELREISERYGDERRTQISPAEDDLDIEDLIADQQMVITITQVRLHQVAAAGHLPPAAPRRASA